MVNEETTRWRYAIKDEMDRRPVSYYHETHISLLDQGYVLTIHLVTREGAHIEQCFPITRETTRVAGACEAMAVTFVDVVQGLIADMQRATPVI